MKRPLLRRLALATLLVSIAVPVQAPAQEARTLAVPPTAAWEHARTGMELPARVGGLVRDGIEDNTQDESDVYATYIDRDEQMIALVYIYRVGAGDVALWFDRALSTAVTPQAGVPAPVISGFTRPGASLPSGLSTATADNVSRLRTTVVAIAPLAPGWLVKIRLGSARLDPAALGERLAPFAAALHWPAEAAGARVAVPIEPCPTPLQLREARIVRPDGTDVIMDSLIGTIQPEPGQETGPPPVYCREPGATAEQGVYRPNGSTSSYLIAVSDNGMAIGVGDASGLDSLLGQNRRPRFPVVLYDRNSVSTYASFNRLPLPGQAFALVRDGRPRSTTSGNTTSISTDALGR